MRIEPSTALSRKAMFGSERSASMVLDAGRSGGFGTSRQVRMRLTLAEVCSPVRGFCRGLAGKIRASCLFAERQ